ncbi:MAG TPA: Gfo/Idh/MocA family oxidoreductase [Candidatus Limnocylindria bacterium]|nr:Gfo/Idh/MocA family oxidoreductase [Candidatus Limnocylindria bacterium]
MPPVIRVALVGFGSIARTHLSALRALPVTRRLAVEPVVAVVVSERAAAIREEVAALGVERVVATLDEALADPELQLFDVTTRNDQHAAMGAAVLAAGRALYIEKPIGRTEEGAVHLAGVAASAPQVSQPGLVMRYEPMVVEARALVASGAIGEVRHGRIGTHHGSYLDPSRPISWRLRAETAGGGAMLDLGVHAIDLVRFIVGAVSVVRASARTIVSPRPADGGTEAVDVDDWAWGELGIASGEGHITVEASRVSLGAEGMPFELFGSEGSLVGDLGGGQLVLRRFDGHEAEYRTRAARDALVLAVEELRPPPRLSLGAFVDLHAASLHHCLLRVAGSDPAPGLAPSLADAAAAEAIAHRIVALGSAS